MDRLLVLVSQRQSRQAAGRRQAGRRPRAFFPCSDSDGAVSLCCNICPLPRRSPLPHPTPPHPKDFTREAATSLPNCQGRCQGITPISLGSLRLNSVYVFFFIIYSPGTGASDSSRRSQMVGCSLPVRAGTSLTHTS